MQHRPSRIGCAAGFGAAGSGVGSLVGMVAWTKAPFPFFDGPYAQLWDAYGGTLLGTVIGALVGSFIGVWYARVKSPELE